MTYRDQWVTCQDCGKQFLFRVEEQRQQVKMGFEVTPPLQCPDCREPMTMGPGLREGVVKWYRDDKHFGFVVQRDGSEIFFHRSNFLGEDAAKVLVEGVPVWYEFEDSDRGPMATNVHLRE